MIVQRKMWSNRHSLPMRSLRPAADLIDPTDSGRGWVLVADLLVYCVLFELEVWALSVSRRDQEMIVRLWSCLQAWWVAQLRLQGVLAVREWCLPVRRGGQRLWRHYFDSGLRKW